MISYAATTVNSAKRSRAGQSAIEKLVAVISLGGFVVKVVGRVAVRISDQGHLDVVTRRRVQGRRRVPKAVVAGYGKDHV